jgi:hypothetical protein
VPTSRTPGRLTVTGDAPATAETLTWFDRLSPQHVNDAAPNEHVKLLLQRTPRDAS